MPVFGQNPAYAAREGGTLVHLLVTIVPDLTQFPGSRPVNITWVQDVSGSMRGEKLEQSKNVLRRFIGNLAGNDHMALVQFDDQHSVLCNSHKMGTLRRKAIELAILQMRANGYTHIAPPMRHALSMPDVHGAQKTIILMTDGRSEGDGNFSPDEDEGALTKMARDAHAKGARLVLIGVGTQYNVRLFKELVATSPNSEMFHVSRPDMAGEIAHEVLSELRGCALSDLTIRGQAGPGVEVKRVTSFAPVQKDQVPRDPARFTVSSGALSTYRKQQLLVELFVRNPVRGTHTMLTLALEGQRNGSVGGGVFEQHVSLPLHFTANARHEQQLQHTEVRNAAIRAQAYRLECSHLFAEAAFLYEQIGDSRSAHQARKAHAAYQAGGTHALDAIETELTRGSRVQTEVCTESF